MSCAQRGRIPAGAISSCQTKKTHTSWYSPAWLDSNSSYRQAIFDVFLRPERGSDSQSHGGKARDYQRIHPNLTFCGSACPSWHPSLWGNAQPSLSILHAYVQTGAVSIRMQFKPPGSFGKRVAFENTFERKPQVNGACPKPHVQDPRRTQSLCSGLRALELRVRQAFP